MHKLLTDFPIAYESYDHTNPKGTKQDNTKNGLYVRNLIRKLGPNMKYLDLGCAGGGFVSQFIKNNIFAIGIDGSDYGFKNKTGEWNNIPHNLFTADITKPFKIVDDSEQIIKFDAISAFDVLEHIYEKDLHQLFINVNNHLNMNGHFIVGIATFPDENYHVTLKEETWWNDIFSKYGFIRSDIISEYGRYTSINATYTKVNEIQ